MDHSLLERLGVKVSICLSNVAAHERVRWLAFHDPLTGALNRRAAETVITREFGRSKRYAGVLSAVFVDLDHFKAVNDAHGRDHGDLLLKYVAEAMREMCRESDVVSRFAGDEFVIILPETPRENAEQWMGRFRSWLADHPMTANDVTTPVSMSFGAASTRNTSVKDPAGLLKKAEERLHRAKKGRE